MSAAIETPLIEAFCAKHGVRELWLFGSAAQDQMDAESDVDVIFDTHGPSPGYFEQMAMTDELEAVFGRRVDLVSLKAVKEMTNSIRRQSILAGARTIFPLPR